MSISNTPIREALSILETEGLVTSSINSKYRVIELSEKLHSDITQAVHTQIVGAYDLCIKLNTTDNLIKLLDNTLKEQEKVLEEKDFFEYIYKSIEFDSCFITATENQKLISIFNSLSSLLFLIVRYNHQKAEPNRNENIKEHLDILSAVKRGEIGEVHRLLELHYNKDV